MYIPAGDIDWACPASTEKSIRFVTVKHSCVYNKYIIYDVIKFLTIYRQNMEVKTGIT